MATSSKANTSYEMRENEKLKLAERLAKWAQLELGHEISSTVLVELLHSSEMIQIWSHVVDHVKSVNLVDVLPFKHVYSSDAPELASELKFLQKKEASLDLEIEELEGNIDLEIRQLSDKSDKITSVENGIKSCAAKTQLVQAYKMSLESDILSMKSLQNKLDFAASELPTAILDGDSNSKLVKDLQETLGILSEAAERGSNVSEQKKDIQHKVKEIGKFYTCQQVVQELTRLAKSQEIDLLEEATNVRAVKEGMEKCFSKLQLAHRNAFFEVLEIENRNKELLKERDSLIKNLKAQMKIEGNCSQSERLLDLELNIIHNQTMLAALTELKMPQSSQIICSSNLEELQENITEKETEVAMLHERIHKVNIANLENLDTFHQFILGNSNIEYKGLGKCQIEKSTQVDTNTVEQNLHKVGKLLAELRIEDCDLSNLCIRPNSNGMMAVSNKNEIIGALDMPSEEAPEFLCVRVREKIKEYQDNKKMLKLQVKAIIQLNEQSLASSSRDIIEHISTVYKMVPDLITKARNCIDSLEAESTEAELKESVNEFWKQPALDINLL